MLFSSVPFLFYFLPVVLAGYFLAPRSARNAVLCAASLFFYWWGERCYTLLMLAGILSGYLFARLMGSAKSRRGARVYLLLSCVVSLGILGVFKYADFFLASFNAATGLSLPLLRLALPIGISFYTFQIISYEVDVYRGDTPPQRNLIDFAAYVALFPQLIAGPIVRYSDIAQELSCRQETVPAVYEGLRRFIVGLSKKVLLANVLGALCNDFRAAEGKSLAFYWLYAVAFTLHIYFDFSGYSDMAIGLGRIFGFHFPENFNYPFVSRSITEFWRRWHMSLGSWFRDYVYIPLGGNRVGKVRWLFNILVVWALTGLWHGAAWNFVLWGLLFAVLLMAEKLGLGHILARLPRTASHLYVMFFVTVSFVLFNADSLAQAAGDLAAMAGRGVPLWSMETGYYLASYAVVLILALVGSTPLPRRLYARAAALPGRILPAVEALALLVLGLLSTAYLVDGAFNPFLYFRF